ncbi:excinuclease ABC subunit C, partial [Acinetobacter baumannii]
MKSAYRRFNIKGDIEAGDDYAMMREVLTRRFTRLLKEAEDGEEADKGDWPDLLLIDGGRGQLKVACEVLAELGIDDVAVAGVSKGPE